MNQGNSFTYLPPVRRLSCSRWVPSMMLGCLVLMVPFVSLGLPLHTGDVNGDEARDVLDVNCIILSALSSAQDAPEPPQCQQFSYEDIDLQCDGAIDVTDVQRLTLLVLHSLTGDLEIENLLRAKDYDLDYIHNDCDPDDDNDTFPDLCEIDNGTNPFNEQSIPLVANACTCPGGCLVDSECIAAGTVNPDVACLFCDGDVNPFGWSPNTGNPCDDGDACTTVDTCNIGSCVGSTPLDCDDDNVCTDDTCDAATGCISTANSAPCADGDPCTLADQCQDGACLGGTENAACAETLCVVSGTEDDVIDCPIRVVRSLQGGESPGGIQFSLAYNPVEVEFLGFFDQLCVLDLCADIEVPPAALSPSGHTVVMNPVNAEDWLLGGSALVVNTTTPTAPLTDAFVAAGFINGDAEIMRASFRLRLDLVEEEGALINATNALGSTTGSEPMGVSIVATDEGPTFALGIEGCDGDDSTCNDGNPCTDEFCDPVTNACVFSGISGPACSDGTACTVNDFCVDGECVGTTLDCDDSSICTTDSCEPSLGCVNELVDCDDGDSCTTDTCDAVGGCVNAPVDCDDGIACTQDSCDGGLGLCLNDTSLCDCTEDQDCDDGNTCLIHSCEEFSCVALDAPAGQPCDSGDLCSEEDVCGNGSCQPGQPVDCDDGNACTTDACDSNSGCTHTAVDCSDGNPCTEHTCEPETGCSSLLISCDDGDQCTNDQCNPPTGCTNTAIDCDDSDQCTVDTCDSVTGCDSSTLVDCDDGDACTAEDDCSTLLGCQSTAVICNDDNVCTDDSCDASSGCVFTFNSSPCADDDTCTFNTQCENGTCGGGILNNCDDANACTQDLCVGDGSSCFYSNLSGSPCDDGDSCTQEDACSTDPDPSGNSFCEGVLASCDDGDPCTTDSCSAESGCLNEPVPGCGVVDPDTILCTGSGAVGEEVVCDILMARGKEGTPPPTASQFDLLYNSSALQLVQFQDQLCPSGGPVCFPLTVPPNNLSPSGHGASLSPTTPGEWDGEGTLILSNASSPLEPLTNAFLSASGGIEGDTDVIQVKFILLDTVPEAAAEPIQLVGAIGATGEAKPMVAALESGILVFTLEDCNSVGDSACEDGDDCSTDICLPDGSCESTFEASCDDGDPCTTNDTCAGGVCSGTPDQVCDDGDACTTDTCTPGAGCEFTDIVCDDDDECTLDSCFEGECVFSPSTDPACAPEPECDAICTVTGSSGTYDCVFGLAAESSSEALAAGLQFNLDYDGSLVSLDNFYDETCFVPIGDGCAEGASFELPVVGAGAQPLYPSGHGMTLAPTAPIDWVDGGSVVIANSAAPSTPITQAYSELGDGEAPYIGATDFVTARFTIDADTGASGTPICISALAGSDGVPQTLNATLNSEGTIITVAP